MSRDDSALAPSMPALTVGDDQVPQILARGNWYALMDACGEPMVPPWAAAHGERAACLYDGAAADDYWDTAPYLLQLDAELYQRIRSEMNGRPWGWLFETAVDLATAKHHWKRFVMVRDEEGSDYLFRFYDPRVVRTFLGAAELADQIRFFGPVRSLLVVGDGSPPSMWIGTGAAREASGGLVMKPPVLRAFSAVQMRRFVAAAASKLRADFPELLAPWSEEQMRGFVESGVERLRGWGVRSEANVLRALELLLLHEELDHDPLPEPWLGIVTSNTLSADDKLRELAMRLRFSGAS